MSISGPRGFAGLGMLVSDVAADLADARRLAEGQDSAPTPPVPAAPGPAVVRAPFGGMSVGMKWAAGLGIGIAAIWLLSFLEERPRTERVGAPAEHARPTTPPRAATPAPSEQFAVKPPVGQGLVLDMPQIRYCLAESIRLDAISPLVNTHVAEQVSRFNARVGDYNSRCSQFKYRSGSLERAREEVEQQRSSIEGLARLLWEAEI